MFTDAGWDLSLSSKKIKKVCVSIVNVDGRVVYENSGQLSNSQQIDTSNLASGVYFISINNNIIKKLIIE